MRARRPPRAASSATSAGSADRIATARSSRRSVRGWRRPRTLYYVEVARRSLRGAQRNRHGRAEEITSPDVELRATGRLPHAGIVIRGREDAKSWWTELWASLDIRLEVEEYIDAGDAVVAVTRQTACGLASGAEATNRIVTVTQIPDGSVMRVDAYRNKRQALEAVGLSE